MKTFAALMFLLTGAPFWQWPLLGPNGSAPVVLRPYAPPLLRWQPGHRGVDLAAGQPRAPVLAAGPGTVVFVGAVAGQGVVVVGHGGLRTSYEPLAPSVAAGAVVVRGQPLGSLQPGHCPSAPCLHWGLLAGAGHTVRYYDPLILLGAFHLRLEPVEPG